MMPHRALLFVLLAAGCSPSTDESATYFENHSKAVPATYRSPQACDARPVDRGASTAAPANGFLFVGKPHLMLAENIRRIANQSYPRQSEEAYLLYSQSNRLRHDAEVAFQRQDSAGLAAAFQRAIELARKGVRLNSQVLAETAAQAVQQPGPSDHLEVHLIEQAYEVAYLSLILREDYSLLARRDGEILALDWSPDVKMLYRTGAIRPGSERSAIAPNAVRGAILSRLIAGDPQAVERFVVFGMRDQVDSDHYPLSHADLVRAEADGSRLDELTFSTGHERGAGRRCSDLFATYVEWLDLRSRIARLKGDDAAKRAISDRLRALKDVPPELVGERYRSAIAVIENRIGETGQSYGIPANSGDAIPNPPHPGLAADPASSPPSIFTSVPVT
jgi:hypothetical protein